MPQENTSAPIPVFLYCLIDPEKTFAEEMPNLLISVGLAHSDAFKINDLIDVGSDGVDLSVKVLNAFETATRILSRYGIGPETLEVQVNITIREIGCLRTAGAIWQARVKSKGLAVIKPR